MNKSIYKARSKSVRFESNANNEREKRVFSLALVSAHEKLDVYNEPYTIIISLQENLEMTVKNGKHKLVGLVNLGDVHTVMRTLSGNV